MQRHDREDERQPAEERRLEEKKSHLPAVVQQSAIRLEGLSADLEWRAWRLLAGLLRKGLRQEQLQRSEHEQKGADQAEGHRWIKALQHATADLWPECEGKEAHSVEYAEQQPAVPRKLANDVERVRLRRAESGGRARAYPQPGRCELAERARTRGAKLANRVDDAADDEGRLAAEDVCQVADGEIEQHLAQLRKRDDQADAARSEAERRSEERQCHNDHADAHLLQQARRQQDSQLQPRRCIQH
mmetsp:Transcript_18402/g.47138  ORF Transcript_18402/g.47138 Transcript_18402/m.47138 type:complete len:245 (+) Transcript_18402:743-1477(+)